MAGLTEKEQEWALRVSRFIKAELKRSGVSYLDLAARLNDHGLEETKGFIGAEVGARDIRGDVLSSYPGGAGEGGGAAG